MFEQFRGNNYALKACRLIKQIALANNMGKLYLTCTPTNISSMKTLVKLGLRFLRIVDLPPYNDMYKEGERQKCIFEWDITNINDF